MKKGWSLRKYRAMVRWWEENGPPVYITAASYLGLTSPKKKKGSTTDKTVVDENMGNLMDLARQFSGSGGVF